jgi:DNA-binding NarL/FixJ family response regulator
MIRGPMPSRSVQNPAVFHHRPGGAASPGSGSWAPPGDLSPAEWAVVAELCQGFTNREIGRRLGKSEFTVKNQVSAILRKVGLPTRSRLIALLR